MDLLGGILGKLMKEADREQGKVPKDDEVYIEKNIGPMDEGKNGELSRRAKLMVQLVAEFNKSAVKNVFKKKRGETDIEKPYVYPEHLTLKKIDMDNFSMELLRWKENTSSKWVILQLHGGGYVGPYKNNYRTMAGIYSEVGRGADVLSIDYRIAPKDPYPAALEDAIAAYNWLLDNGYTNDQIIVAGDSAGGGLALALTMWLRDNGKSMPAGVVVMSPWTDLTASGSSYKDNKDVDPVFGHGNDELIYDSPYIGDNDSTNPYISPMFGSFEKFPPMLIQVGTREMLFDDSEAVAKKAKKAGVKVRYSKYEGMFHVFQMATTFMPESKAAWVEVGRFLDVLGRIS